jgi:phage recombination protein Bet
MTNKKDEKKQTQSKAKAKESEKKEDKQVEESNNKQSQVEASKEDKKEIQIIEKIIENKEIAPDDAFGKLSRPQINLIKRTIAKGADDDELRLFIQICKGANLNPFLRQAFLVPRWDSKFAREIRTVQISIDGFRSIAESSGAYAGNDDPIFSGEIEIPVGKDRAIKNIMVPAQATVTVYKMVGSEKCPFTATARWTEYYPGPKLGFQWHIRPHLMLGKCAEALALRKAFPKLLSGMYAQEEMDKTLEVDAEEKRNQTAYNQLVSAVGKASQVELKEYLNKIENSEKYSEKQKEDFKKMVENRLKKIETVSNKADESERPEDLDDPIIVS